MSDKNPPVFRTYYCSFYGLPEHSYISTSAGNARYQYLLHLWDCGYEDASFANIRVRSGGRFIPGTNEDFEAMIARRGIPFAKVGMRVSVEDRMGTIMGSNYSGNLDVIFDDAPKMKINCHPHWMTTYFDENGAVIRDYREQKSELLGTVANP